MKIISVVLSFFVLLFLVSCNDEIDNEKTSSILESRVSTVSEITSYESVSHNFVSSCNSFAGGYAAYFNENYYYADIADSNKLYVYDIKNQNTVCIDETVNATMPCIKIESGCIFYTIAIMLDSPIEIGDYSITFEKHLYAYRNGEVALLSNDNIISYDVCEEYIFYTAADMNVYRMKLDGSEKTSILKLDYPMNVQIYDKKIYFHISEIVMITDYDGKISEVYNLPHYQFVVDDQNCYYIHLDSLMLIKSNDMEQSDETIIDESICAFTVYNDKLIYQKFGEDKIYTANLDGSDRKFLCEGKQPLVVNNSLVCIVDGKINLIK